ncbi:group 3 secretory phospholipase A2-like [Megalops cyprinoides]|uniref:group 3 secretory phospholipase A2-like n=1 Tax=Megalops cyprinoides TaxID=118141 RepID=UPI001864FB49|nr:group 3 secretory phospholipase A2-like [Megalops cyprinoides]
MFLNASSTSESAGKFLRQSVELFNTSILLVPGNPCVIHSATGFEQSKRVKRDLLAGKLAVSTHESTEVSAETERRRTRRSWIFPGTLWCGTGTKAIDYEEIGMFEKTDKCCREHDHCKNTIPAFRVNYGVFNSNLFTVSHCDCDQRFRQCLMEVNDPISHMVGYSFFSVLKVPCFEFTQKKHCTQISWWGLHKPSKHPKGRRRCGQRGPSRGDTFRPSRRRAGGSGHSKGRKATVKLTMASPAPTTSTSTVSPVRKTTSLSTGKRRSSPSPIKQRKQLLSENALPTALPWDPKMHAPKNLPAPVQDTRYKDKLQLCDCYKQLDECKYKILPLEERYGLRNLESKILYNCNCTRRLARQLRQLKEPSAVQSLLLDFVSLSCFKMPRIEDCPQRKRGP